MNILIEREKEKKLVHYKEVSTLIVRERKIDGT